MKKNAYQIFKEQVLENLENKEKPLKENQIEEEVNLYQTLQEVPEILKMFERKHNIEKMDKLDKKQWELMVRELEVEFDVQTNLGIVVMGEEQKQRDYTWWTMKEKIERENYYSDNYKKFISNSLPNEVIKVIEEDTDAIMNHLGNPSDDQFERYGMVVGHVQSGKTANYSSLVCKAADAGYKFIVIIAGAMNNLRNQTQERLNASFIGRDIDKKIGVANLAGYREDKRPISLTSKLKDFNRADANRNSQGISLDSITSPVIVVIKKNTSTLKNVIQWITTHYSQGVENHAMLLIDDESDYASINTKDEEDPTKINEKIRALLKLFKKSSYVAYTATPYANIFIDHNTDTENLGKDLFPEDFIYCLSAPSNYFGAEKIFLDKKKTHFYEVEDVEDIIPFNHKKDYKLPCLPESMKEAMRSFLINIAIRHLRNQENKHNSMLIHATRFTEVHKNIAGHVEKYFKDLSEVISIDGLKEKHYEKNEHLEDLKNTFEIHYKDNIEFEWESIIKKIAKFISKILIVQVHKDTKIKLEYRDDIASNVIAIGGTSLARGYTLEGLSVSYFLRNTIFYDTLMQMGRWFGYRPGYEDLCKIYTTNEIFDRFNTITEATLDLVSDLNDMARNEMTPRDFGLAVKQHPDSGLQVTAKNKLKNSESLYYEMKLDGHLKETSWIIKDKEKNEQNINLIKNLIENKITPYYTQPKPRYWIDVPKNVVSEFINNFSIYEVPDDDFGMRSKMPIKFIKQYIESVDTFWDVAIYSGNSEQRLDIENLEGFYQERKINDRGRFYEIEHRQVSSGNAENIAITVEEYNEIKNIKRKNKEDRKIVKEQKKENELNEVELYSVRKAVRNIMKKPLLMLHIIDGHLVDSKIKTDKAEKVNLAAFGISFPGGIKSMTRNVRLQVNSVYLRNMKNMLEDEVYDD
ncbi:Z1 domain-containing protein [Exiguobacterium sp. OS-77]|uniref:Z1 domain-containing protein n=1 Tax=Exiguobacterium sp. OS-77 TaxID=1241306 RepID=UPI0003F7184A|nr:Z1 domain-containing protein [Exiguobacterium sp. OS-77]